MPTPPPLLELDSLTIQVLIDNELDPISSSPHLGILQSGNLKDIAFRSPPSHLPPPTTSAGNSNAEGEGEEGEEYRTAHMSSICHSAHGLSLLITGSKDGVSRTILFDAGPEGRALELNARRLGVEGEGEELGGVERVVLSHWHRDHSGGLVRAVEMIREGKQRGGVVEGETVVVDLHPDRPALRGVKPPSLGVTIALGEDPTFEEIEGAGAVVERNDQPHAVLGGMFVVSGEIPRVTGYEVGLKHGVRLEEGKWVEDCLMRDERLVMARVRGKGIVMFTGCSHAGVVNAARHALELGGGDIPLYAVMGGYHLADAEASTIQTTVSDLKALDAQVLLTGHCTGWRAKFEINNQMPGRLVPSFVGSKFVI